jgi:hypothetical protein
VAKSGDTRLVSGTLREHFDRSTVTLLGYESAGSFLARVGFYRGRRATLSDKSCPTERKRWHRHESREQNWSARKNTSGGREMSSQLSGGKYESESVIPFAPAAAKSVAPDNADQLDKAGQTILRLLHKAAGVAEANSHHALEMARKLSHQLRAAEDRIAELEAEVGIYQEKADRAEQWLHKVYTEIEDRFLRQEDSRRSVNGAPKRPAGRGA